ncbi:MAG: hypothetical protein RJQ09_12555 [Cyclobacteriaceae bacterium]
MKRHLISLVIVVSVSTTTFAQFKLGLNADIYKPQNQFGKNVSNAPVGMSIFGLYTPQNSRFSFGSDLGVAMYANRTYDYELAQEGAPGSFIEVDEEDCFLHLDLLARYNVYQSPLITLFGEVKAGMYTFFSSRIASEPTLLYQDDFEFHGTSFNTGVGGGFSLNLSQVFDGKDLERPHPISLEFTSSYNSGTTASYRNMGNESGAIAGLETGNYRSIINNLNFRIGVAVQL